MADVQLFAHSGNVCAFPGCNHPLIDRHGNFVAEVCHTEAAEPGGQRFNTGMSNEDRRHRDNRQGKPWDGPIS